MFIEVVKEVGNCQTTEPPKHSTDRFTTSTFLKTTRTRISRAEVSTLYATHVNETG